MTEKYIFLTGFMGSGKTRIGRILAQKLKKNFVDTDDYIEDKLQKTIKQIFDQHGEPFFRKLETEIIKEIIDKKESIVVSLGGGALLNVQNITLVQQSGLLIYIESGLEENWQRTKNKTKRPLLLENGVQLNKTDFMIRAQKLFNKRKQGYNKADIKINRDGIEADCAVEIILDKLKKYKHISGKTD